MWTKTDDSRSQVALIFALIIARLQDAKYLIQAMVMKVVLMNIRIRVMMLPKSDGQSLRLRYYAGWNMYGALVISSNTLWQHRQLQAISLTDKRTKVDHYI